MTRGLDLFAKDVRGLLTEHCLKCHGGEKTKGDFDLSTREDLLKGGAEGPAVVPFQSADSWMMELIRHEDEPHMPSKKPKLSESDAGKIAAWIDAGAPYDKPLIEGKKPARDRSMVTDEDRKWWAFQPLARVVPPAPGHPIDAFLSAKAATKNLQLAPPAEPRVLARRMYLGLTGLPPTPEQAQAFIRDCQQPATDHQPPVAAAVDTLLASPRYGERWARHWLDVARFAESSGFEHDYDRPGAFHYRDFVIKALNADMPYDQFLHWQVAGDEFAPDDALAFAATGFLGAGVFPTQITANEVERTRYDAMDDMLSTTGAAFLGLTIGCARCHDHKFDPIPTRDYYRLLSTFTTTTRAVLDLDMEPEKSRAALTKWEAGRTPLLDALAAKERALRPEFEKWLTEGALDASGAAWAVLELTGTKSKGGATFKPQSDGSVLVVGENAIYDTYTFTATTGLRRITGVRLDALAHSSMVKGGPGRAPNGNFGLSKITVSAAPAKGGAARQVKLEKAAADFEQNTATLSVAASLDDIGASGWAIDPQFGRDHSAIFSFAEPVDFPDGAKLTVTLEFNVNGRHNIGRPRLSVMADAEPVLDAQVRRARIGELLQTLHSDKTATLSEGDRGALFDWWKTRDAECRQRIAALDAHDTRKPAVTTQVFACVEGHKPHVMHSQGANFFEQTHILKRGNTDLKEEVATPGFLQVLARTGDERRWLWTPPEGAKFSGRRRGLANWLTDVEHGAGALAARVIVNRLWQHHFGRGLVETPNDFGQTGAQPSHPELLDWLARELIRNEWRLKPLHRLMLTSAAYAQTSVRDAAKEAADPDNSLFARRLPQRLEGEALRDSMLAVAGLLDDTMFGPGTKDERSKRRSIYFTVKRSQLIGSMVVFDAPEPLVSQGARPTTTVAPQALLLMNGPQVREWSDAFARRLGAEEKTAPVRAYEAALGRPPDSAELADAIAFLAAQTQRYTAEGKPDAGQLALTDFCQVIFGLNEFAYAN